MSVCPVCTYICLSLSGQMNIYYICLSLSGQMNVCMLVTFWGPSFERLQRMLCPHGNIFGHSSVHVSDMSDMSD